VANHEVDHHGLVPGAGNAQISSRHHGAGTSPDSHLQARSPKGVRRCLCRSGHVPPKVANTPLPRPVLRVFGWPDLRRYVPKRCRSQLGWVTRPIGVQRARAVQRACVHFWHVFSY